MVKHLVFLQKFAVLRRIGAWSRNELTDSFKSGVYWLNVTQRKKRKERRIKGQFLCSCQWVGFITLHRILIVKMVFHNSTRNGWWTASSASQDGDSFVKSVQAIISVEPAPRSIEVSLSIFLISLSVSVYLYEFKLYRHDGSYGSIVSQFQN